MNVLLIEDDLSYAKTIKRHLTSGTPRFHVDHVERLEKGIDYLILNKNDAVLLDLSLPDSQGINTLIRLKAEQQDMPVVVLTGDADEHLGLEALKQGAEDYLVKGKDDEKTLGKSLQFAVERHRRWQLSWTDELTGLYNRRGFYILSEQLFKMAKRQHSPFLLMYIDVDDFKSINDSFGHSVGDKALVKIAESLKATFRTPDLIARLGGDEFVVLAMEARKENETILAGRLENYLRQHGSLEGTAVNLSISYGFSLMDPAKEPATIENLIEQADNMMYAAKRSKKIQSGQTNKCRGKILVIEDDEAFQKILSRYLRRANFEVLSAQDGETGLRMITEDKPDLIILDLGLPKISGEEVCKTLKDGEDPRLSSIPIIMLTGRDSDVDRVLGRAIGANAYMTKPFLANNVLTEIEKQLGLSRETASLVS